MVKYPSKTAIRQNVDLTFHGLCTHISKDLSKFIKRHIFSRMEEMKGLSVRELDVLMCAAYFDEPVTPTDIAVTIRFDPATVTRAVQRLLERGMLEKVDNFEDSRSALLSLSEAGRDVADTFRHRSADALAAAGQHMTMILTENEKSELLRLLLKMRNRSMEFADLKKLDIPELGDTHGGKNVVEFAQERADRA